MSISVINPFRFIISGAADGINRIPAMTGATTSGVTISCSSPNGASGYEPWRGANQVNGDSFFNGAVNTAYTWTVDFGSGNSWIIRSYTMTEAHSAEYLGGGRHPTGWTFEASNDGSSWTALDTKSGQTTVSANNKKTFPISNTTAYRYYRFSVAALSNGNVAGWAEVEFCT